MFNHLRINSRKKLSDIGKAGGIPLSTVFDQVKKLEDKKILFVLPKLEKDGFVLSTRNIARATLTGATTLNPYIVFDNEAIIFVGDALKTLETHLKSEK